MAKSLLQVIQALKNTAVRLNNSPYYQWGHMGSCNCGFLAQEVVKMDRQELHRTAMEGVGDWNEQLNDYCPTSGFRMDAIISQMIAFGFDTDDLKHLERLSDLKILSRLPGGKRYLKHNRKSDVVIYLLAWANLLEDQLISGISITEIQHNRENTVTLMEGNRPHNLLADYPG